MVTSRASGAYGRPLDIVTSFIYLGRVILAADDNWPAVILNLVKVRAVWRRTTRILIREGTRLRMSVFFFKSVIHLVFLFGAETWVVTPFIGRVLGGFKV